MNSLVPILAHTPTDLRSARVVALYSVARFGSVHGREYAPASSTDADAKPIGRPAALSSIRIYFAGVFEN